MRAGPLVGLGLVEVFAHHLGARRAQNIGLLSESLHIALVPVRAVGGLVESFIVGRLRDA